VEDSEPLLIDFLHSCRNNVSADELDEMEEGDETEVAKGIEELHRMPEDDNNS